MTTLTGTILALQQALLFENSSDVLAVAPSAASAKEASFSHINPVEHEIITLRGFVTSTNVYATLARITSSGSAGYKPAAGKKFIAFGAQYYVRTSSAGIFTIRPSSNDVGQESTTVPTLVPASTQLGFKFESAATAKLLRRAIFYTVSGAQNVYQSLITPGPNRMSFNLFGIEIDDTI